MNKNKVDIEESKARRKTVTPKKKNKGKHKKKVMRVVIYITLVVFVLSLLFLIGFGIYKLSTSSKFKLASITFEGNEKYSYEELKAVLSVEDGTNLFKISRNKIKENLETLPYIEEIKVSKKYPDSLIIKVVEHKSYFFAYNKETNKYVKLTKQGNILEQCTGEEKGENELIVFGINFDDELGKEIVDVEKTKIANYIYIKEKYDETNIDKEITSVEFKEGNIVLTLNHDINVIMDTEDTLYKLSFLKSILNEISGKAGTIDMTIENPIFRETIK